MGTASKRRKPNEHLRYQRHLRGWTLREVADKLYDLCASEGEQESGMSADTVGRWELGVSKPSLFYQQKLCALFGQSAEELGLIEPLPPPPERLPAVASRGQPVAAVPVPSSYQPADLLDEAPASSSEQALGAWLAAGAADLSALCAAGWSLEEVLTSLQVVLKGVQAMSHLSRRRLLQLGTAAVVSSVPMPEGRHISAEERANLHSALGESIGAGWKLFHTSSMPQVLAVGQAQLYLVQQSHNDLYSSVRPLFYSGIYSLTGAALYFQGQYEESLRAHNSAYIAALEVGDNWSVAQSKSWQAYVLQALDQYAEAIQAIEAALRLLMHRTDEAYIRLRGHLLASWAENAAMVQDKTTVQEKLEASAELADQIGVNEEFDLTRWLQQAGNCALKAKDYTTAINHFELALAQLPPNWVVRHAITLIPLAVAYARRRERDASIAVAGKAMPVIEAMHAPVINRLFVNYINRDLLELFPRDTKVQAFVNDIYHRLPHLNNATIIGD